MMGLHMSDFEEIDGKILEETIQHLKTSTCTLDALPTSFFKSVLNRSPKSG
jgi:hypothetical protein